MFKSFLRMKFGRAVVMAAACGLSVAAFGKTYVWTGAAGKGVQGKYYMNTPANWQDNELPVSADDTVLDFSNLPNEATTINNDMGPLRIRGFIIDCPLLNALYYFQAGDLTLVASGTGTPDAPDSKRTNGGNFYWQGNVTIEGDYVYYTAGNRTYLDATVVSDEDAKFRIVGGGTTNLRGDWTGFKGMRSIVGRTDLCENSAGPANVPIYGVSKDAQLYFDNNDRTYHCDYIFPDVLAGGKTVLCADGNNTWDGLMSFANGMDNTLSATYQVNAGKSITLAGGFTGAGITVRMNIAEGGTATFTGSKTFGANAMRLVAPGTLILNRQFPDLGSRDIYCAYGGTIRMGVENALSGNRILFGEGKAITGTIDLNGFDQTARQIAYKGDSDFSYNYSGFRITSPTPAKLTVNEGSCIVCAVVDKNVTVCASNITLTANALAASLSTGTFAAMDGGAVNFANCASADQTKALDLDLGKGTKLTLPANTALTFNHVYVDGSALLPGTYDASALSAAGVTLDGTEITVLAMGKTTPGETFVWKGGSDAEAFDSDANWNGDAPQAATGRDIIDFTSGSASAVVSGTAYLHRLLFGELSAFTFAATGAGKVGLLNGGLDVASGTAEISAPLNIEWTPQTWTVAANAKLKVSGKLSSGELLDPVTVIGSGSATVGMVELAGDNSDLTAPLVVTNGAQLTLTKSLSKDGKLSVFGLNPNANYDDTAYLVLADGVTNASPVDILGSTGYICAPNANVGFGGLFTVLNGGTPGRTLQWNLAAGATCTFAGGIDCGTMYRFNSYLGTGAKVYVTGHPIQGWTGTPANAEIDLLGAASTLPVGEMHLAVTGNDWRTLRVMNGGLVCEVDNALARDGWVLFGRQDYCAVNDGDRMFLDLNGHDQLTSGAATQWNFTEGKTTYKPDRYATVKSATPATLTMTPTTAYSSVDPDGKRYGALRFSGWAGLHFAPGTVAPEFNLAYQASDTKGTLEVSSGTLNLVRGATWGGSSNVVVNGTGTLGIDATSADAATFGGWRGKTCLQLSDSGKISIPAGKTVKVNSLCIDGEYLPAGTYGSVGSGAENTKYASHFVEGGGILSSHKMFGADGLIFLVR